jgi:transketolase
MKIFDEQVSASATEGPAFEARCLRRRIVEMAFRGQTAHVGCALSLVEILAVLYRDHLRLGTTGPRDPDRDYLLLSKGHGVMAQYACLRELGWLEDKQIEDYFRDGSSLHGLSHAHIPGLEVTSGSLGHGLSIGVGLALGCLRRATGQRVFVIVGDGEINAGPVWEACLFAAHHRLRNLTVIVDANGQQALGRTEDVMGLGSITSKFSAFGWKTAEVDGHDETALSASLSCLISNSSAPGVLVARTIKGYGISFMEDDNSWHYRRISPSQYEAAIAELNL